MEKLWIFGAGGHGAVVADIALKRHSFDIAGFLDDDAQKHGTRFCGYTVAGGLAHLVASKTKFIGQYIFLAIGDNAIREKLAKTLADFYFPLIVDPTTVVGQDAKIGNGTIVMPGAVIEPFAHIGQHCIVNNHAVVGHNVVIGDFCHIGGGAIVSGQCTVGCGTLVGINSCIVQNLNIGRYCRIGAGSVVTRSYPDKTSLLGNPARVLSNFLPPNR